MKRRRLVLGITGGIASGKSTVMAMLARHGISGISSDTIAHHAIRKATPVYRKILERYGRRVCRSNQEISRMKLAKSVFADPAERKWLEKQVHPVVVRELKRFIRDHRGLIAIDIPLLFEAGLGHLVDQVVVVDAPQAVQIRRLTRRNGYSEGESLLRIRAQIPLSRKKARADVVLSNAGSLAQLRKHVDRHLADWKKHL